MYKVTIKLNEVYKSSCSNWIEHRKKYSDVYIVPTLDDAYSIASEWNETEDSATVTVEELESKGIYGDYVIRQNGYCFMALSCKHVRDMIDTLANEKAHDEYIKGHVNDLELEVQRLKEVFKYKLTEYGYVSVGDTSIKEV